MDIEIEQETIEKIQEPFSIIRNARSSRASRSRKSSVHTNDKEKPKFKTKKLRKMTLNPETFRFHDLEEITQNRNEQKAPHSQKGAIEEEDLLIEGVLDLQFPAKNPSKKEQQLQNGIFFGIVSQRELDSDFNLSGWHQNFEMDLQMKD